MSNQREAQRRGERGVRHTDEVRLQGESPYNRTFEDNSDKNAHHHFQQWRNANQDGFFLNQKSGNSAMLHVTLCTHSGDTACAKGKWGSLTKNRKVCSGEKEELLRFARKDGILIEHCSDCKP